jgi:hypothetical protein
MISFVTFAGALCYCRMLIDVGTNALNCEEPANLVFQSIPWRSRGDSRGSRDRILEVCI